MRATPSTPHGRGRFARTRSDAPGRASVLTIRGCVAARTQLKTSEFRANNELSHSDQRDWLVNSNFGQNCVWTLPGFKSPRSCTQARGVLFLVNFLCVEVFPRCWTHLTRNKFPEQPVREIPNKHSSLKYQPHCGRQASAKDFRISSSFKQTCQALNVSPLCLR